MRKKGRPLIRTRSGCLTLLVVALFTGPTTVGAQTLVGRSRLDLRLATRFTSQTSTSPDGVVKTSEAGGILPSIGYAHWFREGLALTATGSLLRTKVRESNGGGGGWEVESAFSVPLLVGLMHFLPPGTERSRWRPWASVEAGPIMELELTSSKDYYGGASNSAVGARFAFAARGGLGLEARLGERMTLSGSAGYLLIPGFMDDNGNQANHEGLDAGITLGLLTK